MCSLSYFVVRDFFQLIIVVSPSHSANKSRNILKRPSTSQSTSLPQRKLKGIYPDVDEPVLDPGFNVGQSKFASNDPEKFDFDLFFPNPSVTMLRV